MASSVQKPTTLLIVDDHPIFRQGLKLVLKKEKSLKIVAEAGDGETALRIMTEKQIDVAVMDIDMPKMNGFEVLERARDQDLNTIFIIMTMYKDEAMFNRVLDLGAWAYVLKENAVTEIIHSVRAVREGQYYISASIANFLLKRSVRSPSANDRSIDELTPTERRVLKLLAEMRTNKEIADLMFISEKTVENHRTNIARKLGLSGTHALLKFAIERKAML